MNLIQLELLLKEINIPTGSYSVNGGLPNEVYCISNENEKWETYYSEHGNKTALKIFETEQEACDYFLIWIKRNFRIV